MGAQPSRKSSVYAAAFFCGVLLNAGCNSNSSSNNPPDTTPPSAPSGLVVTVVSSTQINLLWTASTDNLGVTGYNVQRCSGAGCSNFAQIATPTTTSFSDHGLSPSTSYSYRVQATDAAGNLSAFSGTSSGTTLTSSGGPVSVSITPKRGGVAASQTIAITATVNNDVGGAGVTWSTTGGTLAGQTSTAATFSSTTAGLFTITAKSNADTTQSASATIGVTDLTGVTTYHNNLARDGTNTHEFALTPGNVNTTTFGKLFSCAVDGAIYAQPLWMPQISVNGAKHNMVIVATMHDSVYAFDADANANPCVPLWRANLLDTAHGGTATESSVTWTQVGRGGGDIQPEIGVTGTPVVDPATNTVYLVSKSANGTATQFFQRLHALDVTTGAEKFGGPASITSAITFPGNFDGGATVAFNPQNESQRPGLAMVNGVIYVAWASHEDQDEYHGWVVGFSASTLQPVPNAVFNSTPNIVNGVSYARGGIWMSGAAPAADSSGNLYLLTGNGTFDANTAGGENYGDSTIKLSTTAGLNVADWFTPADQSSLDGADNDHGSGGTAIIVNTPNGNFVIGGGKEGTLFLLDQTNMGHYGANATPANSNARQSFTVGNSIFSTAAFWNNSLYIAPAFQPVQAYPFNATSGMFNTGGATLAGVSFAFPGATPSISANGNAVNGANGIVWAIDSSQYCTSQSPGCGPAVLHAFDATNLPSELWNSSMVTADKAGFAVKFTVPTVANGKAYIGTRGNDSGAGTSSILGELDVYGLKPN